MRSALPHYVVIGTVFVMLGLVATTQAIPAGDTSLATSSNTVEVTSRGAAHWWEGPGVWKALVPLLIFVIFSGAAMLVLCGRLFVGPTVNQFEA